MLNKLSVNDFAPNFSAVDVTGKNISLKKYKGKNVLLVFLRYAGCPWCNLAVHRLAMEYPILKQNGCEVIAFIQSDAENIENNIYKRHSLKPDFPIIADKEMNIYKIYGIKKSLRAVTYSINNIPHWVHAVRKEGFKQSNMDGSFFIVPATFLLSARSKKILYISKSADFYEHESFTKIYEHLVFKE